MVEIAPGVLGDLLIFELAPEYCRDTKMVPNATGAAITLEVGAPLDDNFAEVAAGIGGADGLVMRRTVIPDGESRAVPCLARGPAVINFDELPTVDHQDDPINMANFRTAIEAITPAIVVREEPTNQETQTT